MASHIPSQHCVPNMLKVKREPIITPKEHQQVKEDPIIHCKNRVVVLTHIRLTQLHCTTECTVNFTQGTHADTSCFCGGVSNRLHGKGMHC